MKAIFQIFTTLLCFAPSPSFALEKVPRLEKLEQDLDFESGCSCSVVNPKDDFLIVSDLEDKAPALVRINGHKKALKWMSSTESSGMPRKGDAFNRVYGDANLRLKLDYKTTFVCGKKQKFCEVTKYLVDVNVQDGSETFELKDLKGECGC